MTADRTILAADPELAPLWQAIHDRLSAGSAPADIATVTVPDLAPGAVAALKSWLDTSAQRRRGRTRVPRTDRGVKVPLPPLLDALGLTTDTLQTLVEEAVGRAVVNRKNGRLAAAELRRELIRHAQEQLPHLPRLRARLTSAADEESAAAMRRLINSLASITRSLPHTPPRALAKLAHDHAGDPHYFDLATPAGQRLVSAVAELAGQPEPTRPDHIRSLLAGHGIIADRLSATVLLHRVRALGDGPIDRRLNEAVTPVALNLLDLIHTPPRLAPEPLTVVENPSVLEAALECASTQPMACTSGQLRAVDHTLFQLAFDQGVPLRYAGDLDAAGLHIAATVEQTYGATLVAMDAALVRAAGDLPSAVPLGLVPSSCDPALAAQLQATGRILYQEHDAVLTRLLDLTSSKRGAWQSVSQEAGE